MRVETSKQPGNHSSQLSNRIAGGKKKEESCRPALSLQDVFSDAGNASGSTQKTSCLPDTGQGKMTQLEGKGDKYSKRKSVGGRKKLQEFEKKSIKIQAHVTPDEFEELKQKFNSTGLRYFSDFLRRLILDNKNTCVFTNQKELINRLDSMGTRIGKIGNNINQIAKYANIQIKTGKVDRNTLISFNDKMAKYLEGQRELAKAYRALMSNKG